MLKTFFILKKIKTLPKITIKFSTYTTYTYVCFMGATNSNEVSIHRLKVSFLFGVDNVHHCISIPSYVNVILVNSKQRYPLSPALVPSAYNAWKSIFQGNKHRPSSTQWQFPCPPLHLHSRLFHFLPIFHKDPLHFPLSAPILFPFPI